MKKNNYYQWRLNYVIKNHIDFREWLIDMGADIFAGHGLNQGEDFKFKMKGGTGILYKTGMCNPFFNKMAKVFKNECMREQKIK